MENFDAKLSVLDLKDKLLVISTDESITLPLLASIRQKVREMGGLGVLYLPNADSVEAHTIDACISQLQTMKEQLAANPQKPDTGIFTEGAD